MQAQDQSSQVKTKKMPLPKLRLGAAASAARRHRLSNRWRGLIGGVVAALIAAPGAATAADATWSASPVDSIFNNSANWGGGATPDGTATFGNSSITSLQISNSHGDTSIASWVFTAGAPAYSFQVTQGVGSGLVFTGNGITTNGVDVTLTDTAGRRTTFTNSSTSGSASIVNNRGGIALFTGSSRAGTSRIVNNGVLTFRDSSSADHATILNNGTINFSGSATASDATITTSDRAVVFNGSSTGGNARLIALGSGYFDFRNLTTSNVTAGSLEGSGAVLGSTVLVVGSNNLSTELSGVISDEGAGGSIVKVGSGTFTLSGTNAYSGTTDVNGGTLQVNGSIASSSLTSVNNGGTLSGTGIVGNLDIASGGRLAPGDGSPGSALRVNGNLALQSGALYVVQIDRGLPSTATVSGTAMLNSPTLAANFAPGSDYISKSYTILSADQINGRFATMTSANLPSGFTPSLRYDQTHAYLDLALGFTSQEQPGPADSNALSGNQGRVAGALVNSFNTAGGIPAIFGGLTSAGLSQASGEVATGTQQTTSGAMRQFLDLLVSPMLGRGESVRTDSRQLAFADEDDRLNAYAATGRSFSRSEREARAVIAKAGQPATADEPRWNVWASAFGGGETTSGNAATGSNDATARVYGTAVGADYLLAPGTLAGFALAGGGTNFNVSNGLGQGRSDLFQVGGFVRQAVGASYVSAALAYGWQKVTTSRTVVTATPEELRAEFNANAWSGRIESGYRFATPWIGITPYAAGQFTSYDLPAYAEKGSGAPTSFALSYAAKTTTSPRSELGARTDRALVVSDALLTLRGRFAWAHDFNTDVAVTPTFQSLPGASFVVDGAARAKDSALATASAEMKWRSGISLAATIGGEFSQTTSSFTGQGVVRYEW